MNDALFLIQVENFTIFKSANDRKGYFTDRSARYTCPNT